MTVSGKSLIEECVSSPINICQIAQQKIVWCTMLPLKLFLQSQISKSWRFLSYYIFIISTFIFKIALLSAPTAMHHNKVWRVWSHQILIHFYSVVLWLKGLKPLILANHGPHQMAWQYARSLSQSLRQPAGQKRGCCGCGSSLPHASLAWQDDQGWGWAPFSSRTCMGRRSGGASPRQGSHPEYTVKLSFSRPNHLKWNLPASCCLPELEAGWAPVYSRALQAFMSCYLFEASRSAKGMMARLWLGLSLE